MMSQAPTKPRFIAPEVVQTSAMDCGPASLTCLLEGFGIRVSYGRLREACQTDVDGTSIDTMEEVAVELGLDAEQIMVPVDHLLMPEAKALPAIVVVRLPDGMTHFVVVWRRVGPFVQIMDPATGRRWTTCRKLLSELYVHPFPVPAAGWREWAGSDEFLGPLRGRLEELGLAEEVQVRLIATAVDDAAWQSLAALDASTRMVAALVRAGGLNRGQQASRALERFFVQAREAGPTTETIPDAYWSVRPTPSEPGGEEELLLRGAVLVRVRAPLAEAPGPASPELAAALEEAAPQPGRTLLGLLRADGLLTPVMLTLALALAAGGVVVEALLFRSLIDVGRELSLTSQRLSALGALLAFVTVLLALDFFTVHGALRMGRRLEARLRILFLEKIPRLGDRYFQSRLISDMAERSHSTHTLRLLPDLGRRLLQSSFELVLTAAGIIWLDPASLPIVVLAVVLAVSLPLIMQPFLAERDLKVRTHLGALSGFYLDALMGLVPVRTHGAERALRREHEGLLVEWARSGLGLQRAVVMVEGVLSAAGFGVATWLLFSHLSRGGELGSVLLLVYWALNLPVLGQEIALLARQYPERRNVTLRLLEPLGAPEEEVQHGAKATVPVAPHLPSPGVGISMKGVGVRAAGHVILEDINLEIKPGSHVAIVGPSGAGKSSLVGILLGWHRPATGEVCIDGVPLDGAKLEALRGETAWVDPSVQLWNRSLADNLLYGSDEKASLPLNEVIEGAELAQVVRRLPQGVQTPLGEGGGLISGGEGQRLRFGRAMMRSGARLVILDEPFRGLDREKRRELLSCARDFWPGATLLCITHDVGETQTFERVIVVEERRIVEDGSPQELLREASRYRALLKAEQNVREGFWSAGLWRRLRLSQGHLVEHAEVKA